VYVAPGVRQLVTPARQVWWWPWSRPGAYAVVASFPLDKAITAANILADPQVRIIVMISVAMLGPAGMETVTPHVESNVDIKPRHHVCMQLHQQEQEPAIIPVQLPTSCAHAHDWCPNA
jgi:hypothetical protein